MARIVHFPVRALWGVGAVVPLSPIDIIPSRQLTELSRTLLYAHTASTRVWGAALPPKRHSVQRIAQSSGGSGTTVVAATFVPRWSVSSTLVATSTHWCCLEWRTWKRHRRIHLSQGVVVMASAERWTGAFSVTVM